MLCIYESYNNPNNGAEMAKKKACVKGGKWSQKYDKCAECGTTAKPHKSRGLCTSSYIRYLTKHKQEQRAETREKVKEIFCRPLEWTPERIEVEAKALIEWAERPDSLVLEMFCCLRPSPYIRETLYKMAGINVNFCHALELSREIIRSRREQGACIGALNASSVQFYHGFYDRANNNEDMSFTEYKDQRAKVKADTEAEKSKAVIIEAEKELAKAVEEFERKTGKKRAIKK